MRAIPQAHGVRDYAAGGEKQRSRVSAVIYGAAEEHKNKYMQKCFVDIHKLNERNFLPETENPAGSACSRGRLKP